MNFKDLLGEEISIITDGLNKPCGGRLIDVSETLLTLKPSTGNNNVLVIPIGRIASICIQTEIETMTKFIEAIKHKTPQIIIFNSLLNKFFIK